MLYREERRTLGLQAISEIGTPRPPPSPPPRPHPSPPPFISNNTREKIIITIIIIIMIFYYSSENVSLLLHKLWRLTVEDLPETIHNRNQLVFKKYCKKEKRKWKIPYVVVYEKKKKTFWGTCVLFLSFSVEMIWLLTYFPPCRLPCIAEVSKQMEAYQVNQFGNCITCKCKRSSIQRFMINVFVEVQEAQHIRS